MQGEVGVGGAVFAPGEAGNMNRCGGMKGVAQPRTEGRELELWCAEKGAKEAGMLL